MTPNPSRTPPTTRRRGPLVVAAAVAAILAAGAAYGAWYLFLRPSGPAAVGDPSIALPSSVAGSSAGSSASSPSPLGAGGVDGTWNVDTTIGSFADFSGSFVGYRVQEQLANIGGNIAVGRTPNVSGTLTIAGTKVTAVGISVDLTTLRSDDQRRDGQLRNQGLETRTYPTGTFALSSPIDLGAVPADGKEIGVTANGRLTLHGTTKDVAIPLKAKLSGSVIVVTGSLPIVFADYGIPKPNSFAVLSIADQGTLELQLFFTKS